MADDRRQPMVYRPRFLLVCLYIMCYITLRGYGEIVSQVTDVRVDNVVSRRVIIGSDPTVPRWRRQVYRALFSPCMVIEEEGRRLATEGKGLVREAGDYGRGFMPQ